MMKRILAFTFILFLSLQPVWGQQTYTLQDTLRGSITPERAWWDLTYYHLNVQVFPEEKMLEGQVTVQYRVLDEGQVLQIDLQEPMQITEATQGGATLDFRRLGNVFYIELKGKQVVGQIEELVISYKGMPKESRRPPWDGGLTWSKDNNGNHFIATSCQGEGASLWWPNKDHAYDEPDSMLISVRVPLYLTDVSNGRLRGVEEHGDGTHTFHWFVSNPINNYGVNLNIGDYVHFSEKYKGEKGILDCDYYVLRYNLDKAREQFQQVSGMLEAFEYWFGPYPFYEDGFKLVETPYLGMEHQSSVTYGNGYGNGYRGRDLSNSGWGLKFDFIIIHESGHEWFANNITAKDIADMWVHEGFTAYSENLYLNYHFGTKASAEYVIGTRFNIRNDRPLIGPYGVNKSGSGDMYYKGANMLHTLRQLIDDDEKWRSILRGLNKTFYHQTVTTKQIEDYISEESGLELTSFFDQYLRDERIPILEYQVREDNQLYYRWSNCVPGFDMRVRVWINGEETWLKPRGRWDVLSFDRPVEAFRIDPNFYATSFNLDGK